MLSVAKPWSIKFENGALRVFDESGVLCEFQNAKAVELFLILAAHSGKTLMRDSVAAALWPYSGEETRRNNFRQVLFQLKARVGREWIDADRTGCSLQETFLVEIDPVVNIRKYDRIEVPPNAKPVVQEFGAALRWLAENNPAQMLEVMRSSKDLTSGIEPGEMLQRLDTASKNIALNHPAKGWEYFWRSGLVHDSQTRIQLLQAAIDQGNHGQDYELIVEASTDMMAALNYRGQVDAALKVYERASRASRKLPKPYAKRFESYLAITMLHAGRGREGVETFDRASASANLSPIEIASSEALKAIYLFSVGKFKDAERANQFPISIAKSTGHFELRILSELASALVRSKDEPANALVDLDRIGKRFPPSAPSRLSLCVSEQAAVIYGEVGQLGEAKCLLEQVNATRVKYGYAHTCWDLLRVRPLHLRMPELGYASFVRKTLIQTMS